MTVLQQMLEEVRSVAILGHVHPDGDCLGSTLGLYNYLQLNYPDIKASVYLEEASDKFLYLKGFEKIHHEADEEAYDLCICLDSGGKDRLGKFECYLNRARKSLCLDHHITNTGYASANVIEEDASSTCEVLFKQMDEDKIGKVVAECLYTGLVHDTGVFKYSCTSGTTMKIAGILMEKGIDFGSIIDNSFYKKTYVQNQVLGRALLESATILEGRCIFSWMSQDELKFYGVGSKDLDGIIDQLRLTDGVEVAVFAYETGAREFKVSMRSKYQVDVSRIAAHFGGGGHVRAAGCPMKGSIHQVLRRVTGEIEKQLTPATPSEA